MTDENPAPETTAAGDQPAAKKTGLINRRNAIIAGGAAVAGFEGFLHVPAVQRSVLFHPVADKEGKVPDGMVAEDWKTSAGDTFKVWRSKDMRANQKTLVLFPGNEGHLGASPTNIVGHELGGNGTAYIDLIKEAQEKGYQVVAANLVGFAGSSVEGSPTEERIYQGAEAVINHLRAMEIEPENLHIAGYSLGAPVAAHAANHLASDRDFTLDRKQRINLTLASGLINFRAGLDHKVPYLSPLVLKIWDNIDTGHELGQMAGKGQGGRINVSFIRGSDDALTPPDQIEAHRKAAEGLNFRSEEIEGAKHFIAPEDVLRQFDEMQKGKVGNVREAAQPRAALLAALER